MTFFAAISGGGRTHDTAIEESYEAGALQASPEALDAARLLARLLSEGTN
jgi:hypothetical protein